MSVGQARSPALSARVCLRRAPNLQLCSASLSEHSGSEGVLSVVWRCWCAVREERACAGRRDGRRGRDKLSAARIGPACPAHDTPQRAERLSARIEQRTTTRSRSRRWVDQRHTKTRIRSLGLQTQSSGNTSLSSCSSAQIGSLQIDPSHSARSASERSRCA